MRIVVDNSKLESTASTLDNCVSSIGSRTIVANASVTALAVQWQGSDTEIFLQKWQASTNASSAHGKVKSYLSAYASMLRYASSQYKTAQYNAVKKAHKIDHFFS